MGLQLRGIHLQPRAELGEEFFQVGSCHIYSAAKYVGLRGDAGVERLGVHS